MNIYRFINWKTISIFGKSKIINRSYIYLVIVPVLAKIFSKIESPIEMSLGGETMELMLVLPFSWKLFFFSALLFTIGSLLYNLMAPSIIKENKSFGEFLTDKKNFSHIHSYRYELGITQENMDKWGIFTQDLVQVKGGFERAKRDFDYFKSDWRKKIALGKIKVFMHTEKWMNYPKVNNEIALENSFWLLYSFSNKSRKIALLITTLFYFYGFILISIVFIQSIIEVVKWI